MEYIHATNTRITLETKHSDSTADKVFIVIIRTIPQYARWFSNIIQTQTDALRWFLFRQLKGITAPVAELKVCQCAELKLSTKMERSCKQKCLRCTNLTC